MIRVLIKASSPAVKAGLESLVRATPSMDVIGDVFDDPRTGNGAIADLQPDVVLAELESRDDDNASEVLEEATNGVSLILLVHGPAKEWADARQQGFKAVLPSNTTDSRCSE